MHSLHALSLLFISTAFALQIPSNVREFYSKIKAREQCSNQLASGFYNSKFDKNETSYCGDHLEDYGIVFLQGAGGSFSNMDIDCDGEPGGPQDDGRCGKHPATQPQTSVKSIIEGYSCKAKDLNPYVHSYVVFGNPGSGDWNIFDPREFGVEKASVMAVVCGNKMFYGIWGDTNGDDGVQARVGEASLSLATACYGTKMSAGDENGSSHNAEDVVYIAFAGLDAVPGQDGADWDAESFDDFHKSLVATGDKLIKRIGGTGAGNGTNYGAPPGGGDGGSDDDQETCSWAGHCKGATCSVAQDCADDLTCTNGKCAERQR